MHAFSGSPLDAVSICLVVEFSLNFGWSLLGTTSVVHDSAKRRSLPHSRTGNNYNYLCRDINNDNNSHQCRCSDMTQVEDGKLYSYLEWP